MTSTHCDNQKKPSTPSLSFLIDRPTFISPASPLESDGVGVIMSPITWLPHGLRCSEWRLVWWLLCCHFVWQPNLFPKTLQGGICRFLHWNFHGPPALPYPRNNLFLPLLLLVPHLLPPLSTLIPNAVASFCLHSTSLLGNYSKKGTFFSGHFCFSSAAYPVAKEDRSYGHLLRT